MRRASVSAVLLIGFAVTAASVCNAQTAPPAPPPVATSVAATDQTPEIRPAVFTRMVPRTRRTARPAASLFGAATLSPTAAGGAGPAGVGALEDGASPFRTALGYQALFANESTGGTTRAWGIKPSTGRQPDEKTPRAERRPCSQTPLGTPTRPLGSRPCTRIRWVSRTPPPAQRPCTRTPAARIRPTASAHCMARHREVRTPLSGMRPSTAIQKASETLRSVRWLCSRRAAATTSRSATTRGSTMRWVTTTSSWAVRGLRQTTS